MLASHDGAGQHNSSYCVSNVVCPAAGCTSQPSMGAIINGLAGTDADTGIRPEAILPLIAFWEQTRGLYAPFEADMRAGSTDVYLHEMPGGARRWRCYSTCILAYCASSQCFCYMALVLTDGSIWELQASTRT